MSEKKTKAKQRQQLVLMRGLQGSGKTTFAKQLCEKGFKRVNKDELRKMIDNGRYSKDKEAFIDMIELSIVDMSLRDGYDVVIDDTNISDDRIEMIMETFNCMDYADNIDASVEFINTPLDVCIERDSKRGDASVGEEVIMRFYNNGFKELYESQEEEEK